MVIEYSIEYSLSLGNNVKTVVSTDIHQVISYCKSNNIEYIERIPELCTDEAKIDNVLADAIEKLGSDCHCCSLVYGNIPTRYGKIFHDAVVFLKNNSTYDAIISMQNVGKFHPEWMFNYNGEVLPKKREINYRRQGLPQKMIHDGHTFIFKNKEFLKRYKDLNFFDGNRYSIFGEKIKPLINNENIIDIDTEKDLKIAKAIILAQNT